MSARNTLVVYLAAISCTLILFSGAGHISATKLIASQQDRQLGELVRVALRRTETAVDHGVNAVEKVASQGPMGCDAQALQAIRLQIYRSGLVKDIRAISANGVIRCSAFSETLEFDKQWPKRSQMIPAGNGGLRLFRVEQFYGTALGVQMDVDDGNSVAGILGLDGALLDIMPAELRPFSNVTLELADGSSIAKARPEPLSGGEGNMTAVNVNSQRYPLRIIVTIEKGALQSWNTDPYWLILTLAGMLGILFGFLLARQIVKPTDPVAALDKAIAGNEFHPYYQPIFELGSRRVTGAEVLARWIKADGTVIPPARFIELAEDTGRIEAMTWNQIERALSDMRAILATNRMFKLSFNIAPRQFLSPEFLPKLEEIVARSSAKPDQITLELTEREAFPDAGQAICAVRRARQKGFKVAIDDVGIGHSGLSQIQRLDVDGLKVDKFFVDAITDDNSATVVIEMLVRLARERGMTLVAEGVEAEAQIEALLSCGVHSGQGYVMAPPLPAMQFLAHYASHEDAGSGRLANQASRGAA